MPSCLWRSAWTARSLPGAVRDSQSRGAVAYRSQGHASAQQQRASADAIMVGLNCILLDDSRLTLREGEGRNPTRIVLDGLAEIPLTAKILGRTRQPSLRLPRMLQLTEWRPSRQRAFRS